MKFFAIFMIIGGILISVMRRYAKSKKRERLNSFFCGAKDVYDFYTEMQTQLNLNEFNFRTEEGTKINGDLILCGEEIHIEATNPEQLRKILSDACVYYLEESSNLLETIEDKGEREKIYRIIKHINDVKNDVRSIMLQYNETYL